MILAVVIKSPAKMSGTIATNRYSPGKPPKPREIVRVFADLNTAGNRSETTYGIPHIMWVRAVVTMIAVNTDSFVFRGNNLVTDHTV